MAKITDIEGIMPGAAAAGAMGLVLSCHELWAAGIAAPASSVRAGLQTKAGMIDMLNGKASHHGQA